MMKKKHYTWEAFEVDGVAFLSSKNPTKLLHTKGCSYGEKKYGHKTREGFSSLAVIDENQSLLHIL